MRLWVYQRLAEGGGYDEKAPVEFHLIPLGKPDRYIPLGYIEVDVNEQPAWAAHKQHYAGSGDQSESPEQTPDKVDGAK